MGEETEEVREPYVYFRIESRSPVLKVTSPYSGGGEVTTRDITKIVAVLQEIIKKLPEIKSDINKFIEEYETEIKKLPIPEEKKKVELKIERIYSQKYNNVWFPIENDRQLKAVLHKILKL